MIKFLMLSEDLFTGLHPVEREIVAYHRAAKKLNRQVKPIELQQLLGISRSSYYRAIQSPRVRALIDATTTTAGGKEEPTW